MSDEEKKDVKEEKVEETSIESSSKEESDEISFEALMGANEGNKIPYSRFKAVNDEKKALKAELENMKATMNEKIQEAAYKEQLKKLSGNSDDDLDSYLLDDYDNSNKEVNVLKEEIAALKNELNTITEFTRNTALNNEIKDLEKAFPAMNKEHVLSLKKMHPDASLEECAKFSHDQFMSHAKNMFEKMVEEKKAAQEKKTVMGPERIRNMKPEERPKSLADARAAMMKLMKG